MSEKPLEATHVGELKIGEITIPCAVLSDDRRVITHEGLLEALGLSALELDNFLSAMQEKRLEVPRPPLSGLAETISFLDSAHNVHIGHAPELLTGICQVYLAARDAGLLTKDQQEISIRCTKLLRGLALIGITSLVDIATGYQRDRDREALYNILETHLDPDLVPWAKRLPEEFWERLFRLKRWQYSPLSLKRPKYLGTLVQHLVFEQLSPKALEELKSSHPEEAELEDIGNHSLERQIIRVTTLMQVAPNWKIFESLFARAHSKASDSVMPQHT